MPAIRTISLSSGHAIPQLGLGLYEMAASDMAAIIPHALQRGIRHFDGAAVYENQQAFGAALATACRQLNIPRSELFITDKLWDTQHDCVEEACRQSLARCGLQYFDLYLVHWPFSIKPKAGVDPASLEAERDPATGQAVRLPLSLAQVWRRMEDLVGRGLARAIGVSNFAQTHLEQILPDCRIPPAVNQIEAHPLLPQTGLTAACLARGIVVEAYAPLGGGRLLDNATVLRLARRHGCSPAAVLLAYAVGRLDRRLVVLFKTGKPERLDAALAGVAVELDAEDWRALAALETGQRFFDPMDWHKLPLF